MAFDIIQYIMRSNYQDGLPESGQQCAPVTTIISTHTHTHTQVRTYINSIKNDVVCVVGGSDLRLPTIEFAETQYIILMSYIRFEHSQFVYPDLVIGISMAVESTVVFLLCRRQ